MMLTMRLLMRLLMLRVQESGGCVPSPLPACNTAKYMTIPTPCVLAAAVQATRTGPVLLVAVVIALAVVTANEMILAMAVCNGVMAIVRNTQSATKRRLIVTVVTTLGSEILMFPFPHA